jgi:hypothetical protein
MSRSDLTSPERWGTCGKFGSGGTGVASYRFYFMTAGDRIARGQDVECDSDDDALARARALHHAHAVEVWQERRKVGRIEAALKEE